MLEDTGNVVKVSAKSSVAKVAGRIAKLMKEKDTTEVEVRCVGAGAVNQGVKAIIKAKTFIVQGGKNITFDMGFYEVKFNPETDGEEDIKTGIVFFIKLV